MRTCEECGEVILYCKCLEEPEAEFAPRILETSEASSELDREFRASHSSLDQKTFKESKGNGT
jgi:hypothetical protein